MARTQRQAGFHAVEVIVICVVIVGVAALVGYRFWQTQQGSQVSRQTDVPAVTTAKDLDKADAFVNQIETGDSLKDLDKIQQDIDSL